MSDMKCSDCGDIIIFCSGCDAQYQAINPAELLDLVERASTRTYYGKSWDVVEAIKSYLSGDPSALKKLAGE